MVFKRTVSAIETQAVVGKRSKFSSKQPSDCSHLYWLTVFAIRAVESWHGPQGYKLVYDAKGSKVSGFQMGLKMKIDDQKEIRYAHSTCITACRTL